MLCEACRKVRWEVEDYYDDTAEPYRICRACQERLHGLALRPLEWYNLAAIHGWWHHLLHDDFYSEEGTADQPAIPVEAPETLPIPSLREERDSADSLLEYSITRWRVGEEVLEAWRALPPDKVLATLERRASATSEPGVLGVALEVAGAALGPVASDFVRSLWQRYPECVTLEDLGDASARCLPDDEGYAQVAAALELLDPKEKRESMYALLYFRSAATLDWIEQNVFSPIVDTWGTLAAVSDISWPRVDKWLKAGRPVSLVALDALSTLTDDRITLIRKWAPTLREAPDPGTLALALALALRDYEKRDGVPRVKNRVREPVGKTSELCRKSDV